MRWLAASIIGLLLAGTFLAPPISAQEPVRTPDGRVVLAIPGPGIIPDDAVAVVKIAGFEPLMWSALKLGLPLAKLLDAARALNPPGSSSPVPFRGVGVHLRRPVYFGLYQPWLIESPQRVMRGLGSVLHDGVLALPLEDEN